MIPYKYLDFTLLFSITLGKIFNFYSVVVLNFFFKELDISKQMLHCC